MYFVVFGIVMFALFGGSIIGITLEKKGYNGGRCPRCGKKLVYFDTDSQGGRGYTCRRCNYTTWVSYSCVDGRKW